MTLGPDYNPRNHPKAKTFQIQKPFEGDAPLEEWDRYLF